MKKIAPVTIAISGLSLLLLAGCATNDDGVLYSYGPDSEGTVVGSRIRRSADDAEDGATPVRVYDRENMKRTGARSVGGFVGSGNQ
ncbi:MAG: hypothetical protein AAFN50_00630 [Pseudomonadota bacterium]